MHSIKQLRLCVGFLVVIGAPPYLVHDFRKILAGRADLLHWIMLLAGVALLATCAVWIFRLKGSDYARFKPVWERPAALIMLILSSPLLLLSALLIRLESPGPAIYRQRRVGKNRRRRDRRHSPDRAPYPARDQRKGERRTHDLGGRPFTIYKIRSMRPDAEEESGAAWSTGDRDPRITRVGRYIRKIHIDEMPQLFNVLAGDMSIVGPRPERPEFVAQLTNVIPKYCDRLRVIPGITGLAQVRQDYDESIEDVQKKLRHDREYIENLRLAQDIKILVLTAALISGMVLSAIKARTVGTAEPKTPEAVIPESG